MDRINPQYFSIGSLFVLAKDGNAEMLEHIKPTLNFKADIFTNGEVYNHTEIDAPFRTTKTPGAEISPDQARFRALTNEVMDNPAKRSFTVRSRYGSGKTTFLQRLVKVPQARAGPLHNTPPDPGEGHNAQLRELWVQELLGLLRRPIGLERPSPPRPARPPHAHLRAER
ncbi:MAG: hypothetical protein ACKPKO_16565, partial [Candidatus Fonsibacter sp.]